MRRINTESDSGCSKDKGYTMKQLIIVMLCTGLLGCATTKTAYVPIVTPPITLEKPPILPCYSLRPGDKAPVVYNALIKSIKQLELYNQYLVKTHNS